MGRTVREKMVWTQTTVAISTGTATAAVPTPIMIPQKGATPVKLIVHNVTGAGTGTAIITPSVRERGGATDRLVGAAFALAGAARNITRSDDVGSLSGSPTPDASEGDLVDIVFTFDGGTKTIAASVQIGVLWSI